MSIHITAQLVVLMPENIIENASLFGSGIISSRAFSEKEMVFGYKIENLK